MCDPTVWEAVDGVTGAWRPLGRVPRPVSAGEEGGVVTTGDPFLDGPALADVYELVELRTASLPGVCDRCDRKYMPGDQLGETRHGRFLGPCCLPQPPERTTV